MNRNESASYRYILKKATTFSRLKLIIAGLIITSLFCYLEWGKDQAAFLFQIEYEVFSKSADRRGTFTHPMVLLPLIGQILLLYSLFNRKPGRKIVLTGIILLGILILLVLISGLLTLNFKIIFSTIPYFLLTALYIKKSGRKAGPGGL